MLVGNIFLAGAFDFDETNDAPPKIASLTLTHESLPWRRRKFEQDAIIAELIKNSGFSIDGHEVLTFGGFGVFFGDKGGF